MKIFVNYDDKRWKSYKIDFQKIANSVDGDHKAEVSIILTNDKKIRELNRNYRNIDKPTNVLSFELNDPELLGDVFISLDTVQREAMEQGKSFKDHLTHIIVHGILHLQGFDHINNRDANKMENTEIKILKKLGIKNPYFEKESLIKKTCKNNLFRSVVLFLSGALASFGFAPHYLWWGTLIGIGTAYYMSVCDNENIKSRNFWKSVLRIYPFTASYALGMFWWVVNSIYVVPELTKQFAIWTVPALFGLALFGGFIFSIPFSIIRCMRQNTAYRPFLFASIWTVILWLREWFLTGFPWNPISNITMPFPIISNSMSLWGALGLTFIIVGFISAFVELIRGKKTALPSVIIFSILIISGMFAGQKNIETSELNTSEKSSIIRLVQPGKSAIEKATYSRAQAIANADENIENLKKLAKQDDGNISLLIFPETTYPYLMVNDKLPMIKDLGIKSIIGATSYKYGKFYNSLLIVNKDGDVEKLYSKSHLVPFGEYRPFGDIIPTPGQLTPGDGPEIIKTSLNGLDLYFVPAICYEIIFSDSLIPKKSNIKPQVIINITNDNWFGKTPGTYQHLDMVRRYAIESGLPIVRANYSGISAFIKSDGNIESYLPIGASGHLDGYISENHETIYRKIGRDGFMIIILMFSIICAKSISVFQKKD